MLLFHDAPEKLRTIHVKEPCKQLNFQRRVPSAWKGNHPVWDTGQDTRNNALILGQSIHGILLLPTPNLKILEVCCCCSFWFLFLEGAFLYFSPPQRALAASLIFAWNLGCLLLSHASRNSNKHQQIHRRIDNAGTHLRPCSYTPSHSPSPVSALQYTASQAPAPRAVLQEKPKK